MKILEVAEYACGCAGLKRQGESQKAIDLIQAVERLVDARQSSPAEWRQLASQIDDGKRSGWLVAENLRYIALLTYNNPHGQAVFQAVLWMDIIHFEDFRAMSKDWQNVDHRSTRAVMSKIEAVAAFYGRKEEGRELIHVVCNSGPVSLMAIMRWVTE